MNFEITDKEAFARGRQDAWCDIAAGKLIIRMLGRPAAWVATWRSRLQKEYSIEIINGGCLVSDEIISYTVGYNEMSEAEIARRFGDEMLGRTSREAQSLAASEGILPLKNVENDRAEVEAEVNPFGWVKCPNCNISFKVASKESWDGQRHRSCQQRLRLRARDV